MYATNNLVIIGLVNGLSLIRRQAFIQTNDNLLPIGHPETNFSEILFNMLTFLLKKNASVDN